MDFIDVFRFEDVAGIGPYTSPRAPYNFGYMYDIYANPSAQQLRELMHTHDGCPSHPSPWGYGEPWSMIARGQELYPYCGFKDLDQLVGWFDDEIVELLLAFGFQLVSYRVPASDVVFGNLQVCFSKKNAFERIVVLEAFSK